MSKPLAQATSNLCPQCGERSDLGAHARPEAACVLSFDRPARELSNLVQALDVGPTQNPLGLGKLWLGTRALAVRAAQVEEPASQEAPGTLLEVGDGHVVVAAQDGDLTLECTTLLGERMSEAALCEALAPHFGRPLPRLSPAQHRAASELQAAVCQEEPFWVTQLSTSSAMEHPYALRKATGTTRSHRLHRFRDALATHVEAKEGGALAVVCAYLARVARDEARDVGLQVELTSSLPAGLFADVVPLCLSRTAEDSFATFERALNTQLARTQKARTYAFDLFARTPELRGRGAVEVELPLGISLSERVPTLRGASLLFWLPPGGCPCLIAPEAQPAFQVEAIDRQLASVARAVAASSERLLSTLPLLDDEERERMLYTWNATERALPDKTVHALVAKQAQETPHAQAVRFGDQVLSYAELDARANRLAHALLARGVVPGELVALCVTRSIDSVAGMLGVLKAGAAYVPVDPSCPVERAQAMLEKSRVRVAVTQRALCDRLGAGLSEALCVDEPGVLERYPSVAPEVRVTPADLACVLFTSGSTGELIGVEIRHRSQVNHALAIADSYGLHGKDRMLCSASLSFDLAAEQIYPALFRGAQVVVCPGDLLESFDRFDRCARELAISAMVLPTAFWHAWVRELAQNERKVPRCLRVLSVGAERARNDHLAVFQRLSEGRVRFFQGHGPTETTGTCTMYMQRGRVIDPHAPLPIGRPLPNTEIYVLDRALEPVPVGMDGELYVGGAGLARGYLGREDLTRERFLPHPFRDDRARRIYKTSEIVRFQPDGQLLYVGRADLQVELCGFRVQLGEIEAVLEQQPHVDECVVMLREDTPHVKKLVAYLVSRGQLDLRRLEARARALLPEYMVPAAFVTLRAFPMTPDRKVDRTALPAPRTTSEHEDVSPREAPTVIGNKGGHGVGPRGAVPWLKGQAQTVLQRGPSVLAAKARHGLLRLAELATPRAPGDADALHALDALRPG